MKVETEQRGAHTVLRPRGNISVGESALGLGEVLGRLEKERAGAVIADLTDVKMIDSTGLGLLVGALRRFRGLGREMILVNPNERVAMLLSVTQLDTLFPVHKTLEEAFGSLAGQTGGDTDRDDRYPNRL